METFKLTRPMPRITVQPGQSLFDVALQHYGSLEGVFDIVRRNQLNGITENVYAGEQLEVSPQPLNARTARFLAKHSIATIEDSIRGRGIGWWQLERDFSIANSSGKIKVSLIQAEATVVGFEQVTIAEGQSVTFCVELGRATDRALTIQVGLFLIGGATADDFSLERADGTSIALTNDAFALKFAVGEVAQAFEVTATLDILSPETREGLGFHLLDLPEAEATHFFLERSNRNFFLPITNVPPPEELIPVRSLEQLDAMRYDPDGNGMPTVAGRTAYETAFGTSLLSRPVIYVGYQLMNDLDFAGSKWENPTGGTFVGTRVAGGWRPIRAVSLNGFETTFDGNGHRISNLYIDRNSYYVGFFGFLNSGAEVRNLRISGNINGAGDVGGIVGTSYGSIRSCYSSVNTTSSAISSCIVGWMYGGTISACYATGSARSTGSSAVGSIAGTAYGGVIITNCYATGSATGNATGASRTGGLVGDMAGGATIINCYSTATSARGGLVGAQQRQTITDSYFDTETSGATSGTGAQTTAALQTPTSATGIYAAWDEDIWDFGTSSQYPVLKVDFNKSGSTADDILKQRE